MTGAPNIKTPPAIIVKARDHKASSSFCLVSSIVSRNLRSQAKYLTMRTDEMTSVARLRRLSAAASSFSWYLRNRRDAAACIGVMRSKMATPATADQPRRLKSRTTVMTMVNGSSGHTKCRYAQISETE